MKQRKIFITEQDSKKLQELITVVGGSAGNGTQDLSLLSAELARADIVDSKEIPADVVTMNSQVQLCDMENGDEMIYSLVFPEKADFSKGAISVLAPVGTAILGYATGSVIEWPVPDGIRRIKIQKILYQPEAEGKC